MPGDRTRTFDNGKLTVTFRTEQDALDFDAYLESTVTLTYGGKELDRYTVKDKFDPYKFFNVTEKEAD